jgi:hypothetical protein
MPAYLITNRPPKDPERTFCGLCNKRISEPPYVRKKIGPKLKGFYCQKCADSLGIKYFTHDQAARSSEPNILDWAFD